MEAPQWNARNPAGSLAQWIETLKAESRRQFLNDGTHVEVVFVFGARGLQNIVPIVGMDKEDIAADLRAFLLHRDSYAYIHISEAVVRKAGTEDSADSLLLIAESRDGVSEVWASTVVMKSDEKMLLDPVKVEGDQASGRFIGLFK